MQPFGKKPVTIGDYLAQIEAGKAMMRTMKASFKANRERLAKQSRA